MSGTSPPPTLDGLGRPLRVGLTGNIGSGKSTVARLLAARGAVVIDADALAREATADAAVLAEIAAALGAGLVKDGRLDRAATAALVFADPAARRALDSIVHPWVARRRLELEAAAASRRPMPRVVVHDVPLLYEVGLDRAVDVVVVVYAPFEVRARRLARRSGLDREQALARDRAQLPLEEKAARADHVIDNGGDLASLEEQVARLWEELITAPPAGAPPGPGAA